MQLMDTIAIAIMAYLGYKAFTQGLPVESSGIIATKKPTKLRRRRTI